MSEEINFKWFLLKKRGFSKKKLILLLIVFSTFFLFLAMSRWEFYQEYIGEYSCHDEVCQIEIQMPIAKTDILYKHPKARFEDELFQIEEFELQEIENSSNQLVIIPSSSKSKTAKTNVIAIQEGEQSFLKLLLNALKGGDET